MTNNSNNERTNDDEYDDWDVGLTDEEATEFDSILDEIDVEKLAREADEEEAEERRKAP